MSEWTRVALADVVDRVTEKNAHGHDRVMTVAAGRGLVEQETYFNKRVASKDLSTYYVIQDGDFVYNKSTSAMAAYGVVARYSGDVPGVVTPLYFAFRPTSDRILPEYLLLAANGEEFFQSLAGMLREGARAHGLLNVRLADFYGATVALPPLAEQRRIVDVMAVVDAQLEALEAEAERASQVLIGALTLEQFGFEEWSRRPFPDVIDFREGPGIMARDFHASGVPLIRLAGLTPGVSVLDKCNYLDPVKVDQKWSHFRVQIGDVLLSTSAALGRVAVVDSESAGAIPYTGIIRMRPVDDSVDASYIPWLLRSADFFAQIGDAGVGTTMSHFGPTHLRKMSVAIPPIETQRGIAETMETLLLGQLRLADELVTLRSFRSTLLTSLLNQDIVIPESYDTLLTTDLNVAS